MTTSPRTNHPVRFTLVAYQQLTRVSGELMARTGRRVSLSTVAHAAVNVAARDPEALAAEVAAIEANR